MTTRTPRPSILVTYDGQPVALVNPRHTTLVGPVAELPASHPLQRMASAMAAYAELVATNRVSGPYSDRAAEQFARRALGRRASPSGSPPGPAC